MKIYDTLDLLEKESICFQEKHVNSGATTTTDIFKSLFLCFDNEVHFACRAVNCISSSSKEEQYILHGFLEQVSITVAYILEHYIGRR